MIWRISTPDTWTTHLHKFKELGVSERVVILGIDDALSLHPVHIASAFCALVHEEEVRCVCYATVPDRNDKFRVAIKCVANQLWVHIFVERPWDKMLKSAAHSLARLQNTSAEASVLSQYASAASTATA